MGIATAIFIGIGLAMDAFAVSLGVGTSGNADRRAKWRLAFHFGFFQGGMTVLGWLLGSTIAGYIAGFDHWVAFLLLSYVGFGMIRSSFMAEEERLPKDPSRGKLLMVLCVATSLDAMAVGLSMAMINVPVLVPALIIGVITYGLSMFGLSAGGKLGEAFGKRMELVGGVILLGIGIKILISHLWV